MGSTLWRTGLATCGFEKCIHFQSSLTDIPRLVWSIVLKAVKKVVDAQVRI
jgi:hypothetical protein